MGVREMANQCLALLEELSAMVEAHGPKLTVGMGKWMVAQLQTCLERGAITQAQYEQALRDIAEINAFPEGPPAPEPKPLPEPITAPGPHGRL
jgi:hypothetical protein